MKSILKQFGAAILAALTVWGVAASPAVAQHPRPGASRPPGNSHPAAWHPPGRPHPGPWHSPDQPHSGDPGHHGHPGRTGPGDGSHPGHHDGRQPGRDHGRHNGRSGYWYAWNYGWNNGSPYGAFPYVEASPGTAVASPSGGAAPGYYVPGDSQDAASLLSAVNNAQVQAEEARLLRLATEEARVKARRTAFDEWQYERANTPTLQDQAEQAQAQELRRILRTPTQADVLSGYALNTILDDLGRRSAGVSGPAIPIDQQLLKQLNVNARGGKDAGALQAVYYTGALDWPPPLKGALYRDETRGLDRRVADALRETPDPGRTDPGTLNGLLADVGRLRDKLRGRRKELTPSEEVQCRRFLNQLEASLRALDDADAVARLRGKPLAEGRSVPELVRFMASKGLVFAPASSGDAAAYMAVYNGLASYWDSLPMAAASK